VGVRTEFASTLYTCETRWVEGSWSGFGHSRLHKKPPPRIGSTFCGVVSEIPCEVLFDFRTEYTMRVLEEWVQPIHLKMYEMQSNILRKSKNFSGSSCHQSPTRTIMLHTEATRCLGKHRRRQLVWSVKLHVQITYLSMYKQRCTRILGFYLELVACSTPEKNLSQRLKNAQI